MGKAGDAIITVAYFLGATLKLAIAHSYEVTYIRNTPTEFHFLHEIL